MSDHDSSGLSEPPPSDDDVRAPVQQKKKTKSKSKRKVDDDVEMEPEEPSPAKKKRAPSPPHEFVLADNADISVIVMFRARFSEAFPVRGVTNFGPQELEQGVAASPPSPLVDKLLCALLYLALNRTKPIEQGHYGRALEEAIQTHKGQWAHRWGSVSPISGGKTFHSMSPEERLLLLKTLVHWSLSGSEKIKDMIKESYKQSRHDDDLNQPLSVQPWGRDGDKRRYWLIEGNDDTHFRLYRESNPALKNNVWMSIAGSIEELRIQQANLEEDGTQAARRLANSITHGIPRFEATEDKRKRREYRLNRKAAFSRPEPGFSLYEGRTRGKRGKYTFSDEEDYTSDPDSGLRSRRQSGRGTPADPSKPTVTASGRQVRTRQHGTYGESLLSGQTTGDAPSPVTGDYMRSDGSEEPRRPTHGRATRAAAKPSANGWSKSKKHIETYNSLDEMDDEDDASSSGNDWDGGVDGDDEVRAKDVSDDDEDMSDASNAEAPSLITVLKYGKGKELSSTITEVKEDPTTLPDTSPQPKPEQMHTAPLADILNPQPPAAPTTTPAPTQAPAPAPVPTPLAAQAAGSPTCNAYPLTGYSGPTNGYNAPAGPALATAPPAALIPKPIIPSASQYPLSGPAPGSPTIPMHPGAPAPATVPVPQHYPLTQPQGTSLPPLSNLFPTNPMQQYQQQYPQ